MTEFKEVKDSGKREEFQTGAVRDTIADKPAFELISPIALRRIAQHYSNGAKKYRRRNWEAGIPMDRTLGSALRHLNTWREGYREEDHLAAAAWNIIALIHYEEMIDRGLLPKELNDIPSYIPKAEKPIEVIPRLRVSLDIDDVLAQTVVDVLGILEEKTGKKVLKENVKGWNLDHMVDGTGISVKDLFGWVWSGHYWEDIQPESNEITTLVNELSQIADVSIVTSASTSQVEGKAKWLEQHNIEVPLVIIPYGKTKDDMPFDIFIDDRPETIEGAVAKGKLGILYSQPWNSAVKEGSHLIRVNTLREAVDVVKKYAG